jgi:hypothetical protein
MSDETTKNTGESERGATVLAVVTVVLIALVGSPCFCYFGIGLAQGVFFLDSGQYVNPARGQEKRLQRDPKYDRRFDERGNPLPRMDGAREIKPRDPKYDRKFDENGEPIPRERADTPAGDAQ